MIRTFADAVKLLESYIPLPEKKHPGLLGLERMEMLVKLLGNPHVSYPTIHVGGTSGKGSTATIIASILATKYKVGLHTSPHLGKITERIRIGSKNISDDDFIDLLNEVYPAIKKAEESKLGSPSYFEIVTCMAFLYFKKQKIDIAVIEVGMGGRYDATNVIKPLVAVITNVGLDHTEILGETVEEIAKDKAGIIKPGIKVVSGAKQCSVVQIIELKCKENKASLSLLDSFTIGGAPSGHPRGVFNTFSYRTKEIDSNGCIFDYFGEKTYQDLKISLLGRHQVENAAIAIRAIEEFSIFNFKFSNYDVRNGLRYAFIPGRLEVINRRPLVILDGAHNPEKIRALVVAIKEIFPKNKVKAVIAIKSGKDAQGILKEILPICYEVIFTKFRLTTDLGDTFSYEPDELLKVVRRICHAELVSASNKIPKQVRDDKKKIKVISDSQKAIQQAIKYASTNDLILVTGSLYLIGEIRKFLILNF